MPSYNGTTWNSFKFYVDSGLTVYQSINGGGYSYVCQISTATGYCSNGNKYTISSTGLIVSELYDWATIVFPWES